jgi:BRCA1 C Terminus (BRCT) domain
VSMPIHLHDLKLAWEARDPDLVPLLEALATQPDESPATPIREGAPTFDSFLAQIRSRYFRRKPEEEQAHYRVEQMKALEAPNAEAPLPDRLRLHEIIVALWHDDSVFARTCLLKVIAGVRLTYGPWRALKQIFKEAEAKGDTEVYGALTARFDMAHASGDHDIGRLTLAYLVRRAWRFLRHTGVRLPVAYPDAAAAVLAHYTDAANWRGTWVVNHVFYHEAREYNRKRFNFGSPPRDLLKHRAFADLWRRSPRPLFGLLERAQSDRVREFATEALKADFRAVLREVEPAWVARLVGVGSRAIDEFVVWILTNVPRFEQGAFRSLGLHEAVLRLFDSSSATAQAYAAEYARTHARDLPVSELVRLVDNSSDAVRKLALDLLQSRDPRTEIGLDAWGWLLETTHGHNFAAAAIRKYFGARELTPEWFKARIFSESEQASAFARVLLPEIHPPEKLGPGFFADLFESIRDFTRPSAFNVAGFALTELARFDPNSLDRGLLQRLLLNSITRGTVLSWVNEGTLKAQTFPLDFLKALGFHPAWETEPWIAELRRSDRAWARGLDFDERLADAVLGWLGDVRRFAAADLGFDWLMRLVDRSEPRYHDFAVETMIKAFTPADFAPVNAASRTAPEVSAAPVNLAGATFVFTGKLATMNRKEAEDKVKNAGGVNASSVTKKLHYLVIGDEGSPLYSGGKKGDKQLKAEQLNGAGANIKIISETAFLQMLSGTARAPAGADATRAGCERLWQMAIAPGAAEARRGQFARKYILRHHPDIGPSQTDRPVDPGAEVPPEFLTFERVGPLFPETRKPLRDFALELARWEFARWNPSADALLALHELPHGDVRQFVAEALLADDDAEKRRFRINPDTLAPEGVYRFCESLDADTRKLGMQIIQRSPRLKVPEELFRLTESPDRLIRGFVIRALWAVYRVRGVTADWKPPVPPAPTIGAAAKKAAAQPEPRGPGVPHRPEKLPAGQQSLAEFLRRVLFEIPPGRPEAAPAEVSEATQRLKPLPARKAKLELVEVMRDLALEDASFAAGVLPLLDEFMTSRGLSERSACLVAVTRIRHTHPDLRRALASP